MKVYERLLGRQNEATNRNLSLTDLIGVFNDPFTEILPTSWGDINTEELVTSVAQAYRENGPVFALTLARMQVFSQARFQWTRWAGGTPHDLFGTADLSILEYPWPGGTTADLLSRMEVDATSAGNAFIRRIAREDRLSRLRPEWCTILLGSDDDAEHPAYASDARFLGVFYRPPTGRPQFFNGSPVFGALPEVAHYAPLPDPLEHYRGMSWVTPVLRTVTADDASEIHKRRFFEHAATPNLAIKFDPQTKIEQVREFKELLEAEHKGVWNAYKTLYLGGGADPVVVGKDFRQLDFAAVQGKGESRLASAAGVPPSWVGFSEGLQGSALNAGNFTAARRRFADGTLAHLWAAAARSLEVLVPKPPSRSTEPPAQLWYDTRSIPFLREDEKDHAEIRGAEAQTMRTLIDAGYEPKSVIAAVEQSDWSLLKHTGLFSVQLQPPGTTFTPSTPAPPAGGANA